MNLYLVLLLEYLRTVPTGKYKNMSTPSDILSIIRRFFEAINTLKDEKDITGLKDFCEKHRLNVTRYYEIKNLVEGKPSRYKTLEIDALYILAKTYKFSLQWLFLGVGESRVVERKTKYCTPEEITITKISFKNA